MPIGNAASAWLLSDVVGNFCAKAIQDIYVRQGSTKRVSCGLECIAGILDDQALDIGDDFVVTAAQDLYTPFMMVTLEGKLTPARVVVTWMVSTSLRISVAVVDPLMTTAMDFFAIE